MAAGSPVCTLDCCSVSGLPCCPVLSDSIPRVFSEVPKLSQFFQLLQRSFHWLLMMIQVFRRFSMLVKKKCLRRSSEVRVVLFSVVFVTLVFVPRPSGVT